jgi:hypothetical protein
MEFIESRIGPVIYYDGWLHYSIERGPQAPTLMIDDDGWFLVVESFVTPRPNAWGNAPETKHFIRLLQVGFYTELRELHTPNSFGNS